MLHDFNRSIKCTCSETVLLKPLKSDSWKASSKFDGCQTSMTINEDGAISFANSIRADTFRKSSTTHFCPTYFEK